MAEYFIIKTKAFNDAVQNGLDEWVYFLKNGEVRDEFTVKGLKESYHVLDVMRLSPDDLYSYNRYQDYLHYKASEMFTLRVEAEDQIKNTVAIQTAKNTILQDFDDEVIAELARLTVEQIKEIRATLKKD